MPTYDRDELQRLIQQYQNDMMRQYANSSPPSSSTSPEEPVKEPSPTIEEENAEPSQAAPEEVQDDETDVGFLQVRVSTENQAVPLPGAVVTVTHHSDGYVYLNRTLVTNESGLTEIIELPTKDRALSLTPGNAQPFTTYTVEVVADGYYPKRFTDLPIYGGVTAIQSVSMLPVSEGGDSDAVLVYPQGAPTIT